LQGTKNLAFGHALGLRFSTSQIGVFGYPRSGSRVECGRRLVRLLCAGGGFGSSIALGENW
jgi:hypothetical protein